MSYYDEQAKRYRDFIQDFGRRNPYDETKPREDFEARQARFHAEWAKVRQRDMDADRAALERLRRQGIEPVLFPRNRHINQLVIEVQIGSGAFVAFEKRVQAAQRPERGPPSSKAPAARYH